MKRSSRAIAWCGLGFRVLGFVGACGWLEGGIVVEVDELDRVLAVQGVAGAERFAYDGSGNRLTYAVESPGSVLDQDGDAILDAWEVTHFGSTRVAGAGTDYDRDGAPDAEECALGTDPKVRNANDSFSERIVLGGTNMAVLGSNGHATTEAGDPSAFEYSGGQTIWYEWTAPQDGRLVLSTAGTRFYTVVGVFDGAWPSLRELAVGESDGAGDSVLLSVFVSSGVTYFIGVDGDDEGDNGLVKLSLEFFGAGVRLPLNVLIEPAGSAEIVPAPMAAGDGLYEAGEIVDVVVHPRGGGRVVGAEGTARLWESGQLDWFSVVVGRQPYVRLVTRAGLGPPNDEFENAEEITGKDARATGWNAGATVEPGEPGVPEDWGRNSVWWKWTAPFTGRAVFSTSGSTFDTVLGIYRGDAVDSLVEIGINDDFGPNNTSVASCAVSAGETYWIRVVGYHSMGDFGHVAVSVKGFEEGERFSLEVAAEPGSLVSFSASPQPEPDGLYAGGTLVSVSGQISPGYCLTSIGGVDQEFEEVDVDSFWGVTEIDATLILSTNRVLTVTTRGAGSPPNDGFSNAVSIAVVGTNVAMAGENFGASLEIGEPIGFRGEGTNSVWWKCVAPADGTIHISTGGSSFDTVLGVFTGESLMSLIEVGSDDDSGPSSTSLLYIDASAGETYWIRVTGYESEDSGPIRLSLCFIPAGETFHLSVGTNPEGSGLLTADPDPIADERYLPGSSVTVSAYATHGYAFRGWSGDLTGEWDWHVDFEMDSDKSVVAHFAAVEPPPNDNFVDATEILGDLAEFEGHNVNASIEAEEPLEAGYDGDGRTAWWKWRAPADGRVLVCVTGSDASGFDGDEPLVSIFSGGSLSELVRLGQNGGMNDGGSVFVSARVQAGEVYHVAVDSDGMRGERLQGSIQFFDEVERARLTFISDYDGAAAIVANPTPDVDGLYPAGTVVRLRAIATSGHRFLGWDGVDRELDDLEAEVVVDSGKIVRVLTESGNPPANDNFANAQVLSGTSTSASVNTTDATFEAGEPEHNREAPKQSVWYRWMAPASGVVSVDTLGSELDTIIAVYTGGSLAGLSPVVSGDDEPYDNGTVVEFQASAGEEYQIAIDSQDFGEYGPVQLHLTFTPAMTRRETWRQDEFGQDADNPAVSADLADPECDGIPNLLEYFLNGPPLVVNRGILPVGVAMQNIADGKRYMTLTFRFPEDRTDVSFAVEVSDDLLRWDRGDGATEIVSDTTANGIRTVVVRDLIAIVDRRRRFIRLVVEGQEP